MVAEALKFARIFDVDPNDFSDEYAMVCQGTCLEPEAPHGACLIFDKREPVAAGDLVVLYFRPELVAPGQNQGIVKRLVMDVPPWVRFPYRDHPDSDVRAFIMAEQTNPRRRYATKAASLLAIHKCMGPVPAERTRVKVSDEEAVRLAAGQRGRKARASKGSLGAQ